MEEGALLAWCGAAFRWDAMKIGSYCVVACAALLLGGCAGSSILGGSLDGGSAPSVDVPSDLGYTDTLVMRDAATADRSGAIVVEDVPYVDPCMGVTNAGRCASPTQAVSCRLLSDGSGAVRQYVEDCLPGQTCMADASGARCVSPACVAGTTRCYNATRLQTCTAGAWADSAACTTGCDNGAPGTPAACAAPVPMAATPITVTVVYQARPLNAAHTAFTDAVDRPAEEFRVTLTHGTILLADTITAFGTMPGTVTLTLPATPTPTDQLVIAAMHETPAGEVDFAVANPGLAAGTQMVPSPPGAGSNVWAWTFPVSTLADGGTVRIAEDALSGAANVYQLLGEAHRQLAAIYPAATPKSVLSWVGPDVEWSCGACAAPIGIDLPGMRFEEQMWIPGGQTLKRYFANSLVGHEIGHWVMESYGRSPVEGGPHNTGIPTMPGQAWAEGWATWYGSNLLGDDPIYFDNFASGSNWIDLSTRELSALNTPDASTPPVPLYRPSSMAPLIQLMDEFDVSCTLFALANGGMAPALYTALASPRTTQVNPMTMRFERGYFRLTWSQGPGGLPTGVVRSSDPAPFFADFLDALDCASYPRARIDAANGFPMFYPYDAAMPLCR